MIFLFADLLLSLHFHVTCLRHLHAQFPRTPQATQNSLRGFCPRRNFASMLDRFAIRYRDCNSNPIAAVSLSAALPTSCYAHPIGFEIRCAQPVKHPNPYPAVRSPLRRSRTEPHGSRVLKAAQISRVDSVTES
jgi:hypothetical protein